MLIRVAMAIAALLAWGLAWAQPAPRTTLDVNVPAGDGFEIGFYQPPGRIAIGADGTHYVLLYELKPFADPSARATDAQLVLLVLAPDGAVTRRRTLPVEHGIGLRDFNLHAFAVVVARGGDLAVFVSTTDPTLARAWRFTDATLFRLAADLSLKATSIGPPDADSGDEPYSFYGSLIGLPTEDDGLMLAGGFGPGAQSWWLGKFSLDGRRLWQDEGQGFGESTAALAQRPDGTWLSVVRESAEGPTGLALSIRRYAAGGRLLARTRLTGLSTDGVAAILPDAIVVITNATADKPAALIVVSDGGDIVRRDSWPFDRTVSAIADGEGIAAIVADSDADGAPRRVVRADRRGVAHWRSAAIDATDIVRTPDGRIAVLAEVGRDRKALQLVHYADP